MMTIFRDLGFFLVALILYTYILQKGVIYGYEALILLIATVFYALAVMYTNKKVRELESETNSDHHEIKVEIREAS
jgi:Ca2+/Na+ antiporter